MRQLSLLECEQLLINAPEDAWNSFCMFLEYEKFLDSDGHPLFCRRLRLRLLAQRCRDLGRSLRA